MAMKKQRIAIPADPDDPDDFDVTEAAHKEGLAARRLRQVRHSLGMSQSEFARRFHVPIGTLRDWEQLRVRMPDFARAYVEVIAEYPDTVDALVN